MNPTTLPLTLPLPLPRRLPADAALAALPTPDRSAPAAPSLLRRVARRLRDALAEMRRRQRLRDTDRALAALDARTLRDLGIHRVETLSVAAEFHGDAEVTRAHVLLAIGRGC